MDVTTPEEARIAEEAGAVAVMALERVPADIRKDGGVARMSDASVIKAIKEAVTIPVMAKARIGHFVEAQILEALDVDYIDESEVSDFLNLLTTRKLELKKKCWGGNCALHSIEQHHLTKARFTHADTGHCACAPGTAWSDGCSI